MELPVHSKRKQVENCPPEEEIETEGQRQLKVLLQNQLQKDVTIDQQLSQGRKFTSAAAHRPEINLLSGLSSLSDFQSVEENDSYIAELKQYGLTEEEIDFKLQYGRASVSQSPEKKRRFGLDPCEISRRLDEIERKIQEKQNFFKKRDSFHGQKPLTRHEMELEKSLLRNSHNEELQKVSSLLTVTSGSRERTHPDDPMEHLPEILLSLTQKQKRNKKEKQTNKQKSDTEDNISCVNTQESNMTSVCEKHESNKSDVTTKNCENSSCQKRKNSPSESCLSQSNENSGTSGERKNSEIGTCLNSKDNNHGYFELEGNIKEIKEEDILSNRLTVEEIQKIPRFEKYSTGIPSNVLFLKNLSPKVTQEDLVALFIRFQKSGGSNILFRLLTGRMKGQAFVTFPDTDKATDALNLVNGLQFKGKPIIIQYGKKPA